MSHPKEAIIRTERCHAITRRRNMNTRCKHTTLRGIYCHQHEKALRGLRIKTSNIPDAGFGLFTTKAIARGAVICKYTGDIIEDDESGNPYALQIKRRPMTFIDASKTNEAEGRFVNDPRSKRSINAVLEYDRQTQQAYVEATRDIAAGEEIFADYGKDHPWKEKPTKYTNTKNESVEEPKKEPKEEPKHRKRVQIQDGEDNGEPEPEPKPKVPRAPRAPRAKVVENFKNEKKYEKQLFARILAVERFTQSANAQSLGMPKPYPYKPLTIPRRGEDFDKWHTKLEKMANEQEKRFLAWVRTVPGSKITAEKSRSALEAYSKKHKLHLSADPTVYY